jgi:hypothetical protein
MMILESELGTLNPYLIFHRLRFPPYEYWIDTYHAELNRLIVSLCANVFFTSFFALFQYVIIYAHFMWMYYQHCVFRPHIEPCSIDTLIFDQVFNVCVVCDIILMIFGMLYDICVNYRYVERMEDEMFTIRSINSNEDV